MMKSSVTPGGKQRWICRGGAGRRAYCYSTTDVKARAVTTQKGDTTPPGKPLVFGRNLEAVHRFVITAAQNATGVHAGFLKALECYCNVNNAELLVIPLRYKNPTSTWTASQRNEEVWADAVKPYLYNARKALNKNLIVLGDVKTVPTASSPLTGFEAITQGESAILGHTKLQLKTVAAPQGRFPKILTTTGAVTQRNYTDSKAGKIGEFHHTFGAAVVEIQGKTFHLRQINAMSGDGSFIDLDRRYTAAGAEPAARPLALVMGDTHVDFIDPMVEHGTFGPGGIIELLKPAHLIWHDLLDGYAVNPHHYGNPFNAVAKVQNDRADARKELFRALDFLSIYTHDTKSIVVPSNHDDFLTRWIVNQDWRTSPGNAEFYLETALAMVRATKLDSTGTVYPSPLIYWGRKVFDGRSDIRFLERDESFMLGGNELGMHGDRGTNGAKGSLRNLRRIGVKWISGHPHSPGIDEGGMQVGTSTGRKLEYTMGPSGWLNTHAVVYANGKRSLINLIDGEYHA